MQQSEKLEKKKKRDLSWKPPLESRVKLQPNALDCRNFMSRSNLFMDEKQGRKKLQNVFPLWIVIKGKEFCYTNEYVVLYFLPVNQSMFRL